MEKYQSEFIEKLSKLKDDDEDSIKLPCHYTEQFEEWIHHNAIKVAVTKCTLWHVKYQPTDMIEYQFGLSDRTEFTVWE